MKHKIIALLIAPALLALSSCNYYKDRESELRRIKRTIYSIENMSEQINNVLSESLDKKVIIIDQTGDTLVNYMPDSVTEATVTRTVMVNFTKPLDDLERSKYELKLAQEESRERMVSIIVAVPCIVILLLVFLVFMFFFMKSTSKNKLISKAIENGYELPDSFYTGIPARNITYQVVTPDPNSKNKNNAASSNETDSPEIKEQPQESQIPPIPQTLPILPDERKYFRKSIYMIGIGISVFLFFICVNAAAPGFLLGGIPFLIGCGRVVTLLLEKKGLF